MRLLSRFTKHWEIAVLLLLSLPPLFWLQPGEMIIGHDAGTRLTGLNHLSEIFYSFNPAVNFGVSYAIYKGFLITKLPELLFAYVTASTTAGQILGGIFWFFAMALAMYITVRTFFPKENQWIIRIIATTLYVYNFYLLQAWFIYERAKFSLYAALPLIFVILYKLFTHSWSIKKSAIFMSLLLFFFNGGGSVPLYGAILVMSLTLTGVLTVQNIYHRGLRKLWFSVHATLTLIVITILTNAFWIIPQAYLTATEYEQTLRTAGGETAVIGWLDAISQNTDPLKILRFQGIPDWLNNHNHPYANIYQSNVWLKLMSALSICLVVCGLIFDVTKKKKSKEFSLVIILALIIPVGVLFTAGTHPPFGEFYRFLITHIPGFLIFRTPYYKFAPVVWFPLSLLAGYYLWRLLLILKNKRGINWTGFAVVIAILFFHFPYFAVNFFHHDPPFSTKIIVPEHVHATLASINKLPSSARILLLPPFKDGYLRPDAYLWGYWGMYSIVRYGTDKSIVSNGDPVSPLVEPIYSALGDGNTKGFIDAATNARITHILWRDDYLFPDKKTTGRDRLYLEDQLLTIDGVRLITHNGPWRLYSLPTDRVVPLISAENSSTHVTFQMINPTQWNVHVTNVNKPTIISLGFQFSSNWKAYEFPKTSPASELVQTYRGGAIKELSAKNIPYDRYFFRTLSAKPVERTKHMALYGSLNAWEIDHDTDIVFIYWPQRLFYLGAIISGITLVCVLLALVKLHKVR